MTDTQTPPAAPSATGRRYVVARIDQIPAGDRLIVQAGGREIGSRIQDAIAAGKAERIPGPFTAETVPVAIEDNYIVTSLRNAPPAPPAAVPHDCAAHAPLQEATP